MKGEQYFFVVHVTQFFIDAKLKKRLRRGTSHYSYNTANMKAVKS